MKTASIRALTVSLVLVACGAPRAGGDGPASLTAADVAAPPPATETVQKDTPENAPVDTDLPSEKLVCRAKSSNGALAEVYLEWEGPKAVGALRNVSPSGMVQVTRLRAERYDGVVVGDATTETDLAVHAVMMKQQDGKQYVRLNDERGWKVCE